MRYENSPHGRRLAGHVFRAQGWEIKAHGDGVTFQVMAPGNPNWVALVRFEERTSRWMVTAPDHGPLAITPLWAAAMWAWSKGLITVG